MLQSTVSRPAQDLRVPLERVLDFFLVEQTRGPAGSQPGAQAEAQAVDRLLSYWIEQSWIKGGALFLRRNAEWEYLTAPLPGFPKWPMEHTDGDRSRLWFKELFVEQALHRLLALPNRADPSSPSRPRHDTPLVAYSFTCGDRELGRLVLYPTSGFLPGQLHQSLYVSITLFLKSLLLKGPSACAELCGDLAQRVLDSSPGSAEGSEPARAIQREFPEVIGRSPKMLAALDTVLRAAPQDVSVLIEGESGVGKELVAKAFHRLSDRSSGPFVAENCAALPESLFEAEVFGAEKGAYTGSDRTRSGLFERAARGTLFLDEIAELSIPNQSKLLRAIQERVFRRVGGSQQIAADFRLITATHRNLEEEVRANRFRSDLYFRVQVVTVRVPALRERREDIPALARYFAKLIAARRGIEEPQFEASTLQVLQNYDWPGNIRELQNEVERAMTLSPRAISAESLSSRFHRPLLAYSISRRVRDELGMNLGNLERMVLGGVIRDILEETGGNKTHAARLLGIPKANLYRRIEKYGIARKA